MIKNNDEYALWAYDMGFKHGLDLSTPRAVNPDAAYRLGFDTARISKQ